MITKEALVVVRRVADWWRELCAEGIVDIDGYVGVAPAYRKAAMRAAAKGLLDVQGDSPPVFRVTDRGWAALKEASNA